MAEIHEILTELVRWTRNRECGDNYIDERHQTAITNATKGIKAQQRERVEKVRTILVDTLDGLDHTEPSIAQEDIINKQRSELYLLENPNANVELDAALKELEGNS